MPNTTQEDLQLGPIVGFTDATSTRIWFRAETPRELVVRWAQAPAEVRFDGKGFKPVPGQVNLHTVAVRATDWRHGVDYAVAQVKLEGLEPGTRYFYEVASSDEAATAPSSFFQDHPPSFRTLPPPTCESLAFAFLSCNDVYADVHGFEPLNMWQRAVKSIVGQEGAHFAILGGDQVYADSVRDAIRKQLRGAVPAPGALERRAAELYGAAYVDYWAWEPIRTFMAHVPCIMMWDDHDIYDGYGSHGNEDQSLPKTLFACAATAFDHHQDIHNPPGLAGAVMHKSFGFRHGKHAFLVIDGRSCRRLLSEHAADLESAVFGDDHWRQVRKWLTEQDDVSHLTVVTGVPLVFMPTPSDALLKVGGGLGLEDDLRDQWSAPNNRSDQLRFLGTLFEFRKRTGANVLSVGGDVHAAAIGLVSSTDRRYRLQGEERAILHQLVSSGIARGPAPAIMYGRVANETQRLDSNMTATFGPVHRKRNFSVIETRPDANRFVFKVYLEGELVKRSDHTV